MLASPLMPTTMFSTQSNADEIAHYRPAKDIETFNSLLPAPIEFIEGSSSGTLTAAGNKYEAVNTSPKAPKIELPEEPKPGSSAPIPTPTKSTLSPSRTTGAKLPASLYPDTIDMTWPHTCGRAPGLYNLGNTCFLNSALQCLLHTPPLLRQLLAHKDDCRVSAGFCMACSLRQVAVKAYTGKIAFSPSSISNNLQVIAKHMRKGRQEDTHEFLRYAIDALQKSCLAGLPSKPDAKIAETTWVHKIFGGRLRSRVTCRDCGHNSDTFDRILDLSLDIFRCDSLKEALGKFVAVDFLKGADKYKCEKCKKHVNAEKCFTIHEAPLVLTVHLKRFSPLGRKISHPLQYDEQLSLRPFMSDGSFGPTYTLYGVICHAGGGPNSGHYYAFVKSKEGRWFEMNDEAVTQANVPMGKRNAYMLFYIQSKGQVLEAAVQAPLLGINGPLMKNGLAAGMKKRILKAKETVGDDEDTGVKVDAKFIGPLLPSMEDMSITPLTPSSPVDPQATNLKAKIEAVAKNKSQALAALEDYDTDGDSDKEDKTGLDTLHEKKNEEQVKGNPTDNIGGLANDDDLPRRPSSPSSQLPPSSVTSTSPAIPAAKFYASTNGMPKKRKVLEMESLNRYPLKKFSSPLQSRTNGYITSNPFNGPISKKKRIGI